MEYCLIVLYALQAGRWGSAATASPLTRIQDPGSRLVTLMHSRPQPQPPIIPQDSVLT